MNSCVHSSNQSIFFAFLEPKESVNDVLENKSAEKPEVN